MKAHLRFFSLAWLITVMMLIAGCSPARLAEQYRGLAIQPSSSAPADIGNRLLVQAFDGNVFTITPDGTARFPITSDASRTRQYQQPTWSPDASQIALARTDAAGQQVASALITVRQDGSERRELSSPFPPFYIDWSPSGEQIAYLSNWIGMEGPSMVLRMVDVQENRADTVAEGSPYYFSWAPDGSQLLAHIGSNRLELQSITGERRTLQNTAAAFAAPQWASDGQRLIYALDEDGIQRLIIADTSGAQINEITDFDERVSFQLSTNGQELAYVLTPNDASVNTLGPLYVVDVETLRTREVNDGDVWGFFWSPDGQKLAYLATDMVNGRRWLRWYVWDGVRNTPYGLFVPTRTFLARYLTFSDQYAHNMRIWSPDSSAFVYTGATPTSDAGVWVQSLDDPEARRVATGVFAAWSPR